MSSHSFADEALIHLFPPSVQLWRGPLEPSEHRGPQDNDQGPEAFPSRWLALSPFQTLLRHWGPPAIAKHGSGSGHSTGLRMGAFKPEECAELLGSNNKKCDYSKKNWCWESSQKPWKPFPRLLLFSLPSFLPKNIHCKGNNKSVQFSSKMCRRQTWQCLSLIPALERQKQANLWV